MCYLDRHTYLSCHSSLGEKYFMSFATKNRMKEWNETAADGNFKVGAQLIESDNTDGLLGGSSTKEFILTGIRTG